LRRQYKILFYSGDTDGAIPTFGTWKWIQEVGWQIKKKYRPYYVDG
jgi:hypothetical protein